LEIIPSIDIKNGKCVKLVQGVPDSGREISEDPVKIAKKWADDGARVLHIIDLDAAIYGDTDNFETVKGILRVLNKLNIHAEVGGGIRTIEKAKELIKSGASWIILGTVAVKDPKLTNKIIESVGSKRVIIAIDSKKDRILTQGWRFKSKLSPISAVNKYQNLGISAFLYTDVDVEGTMKGVNVNFIKNIVKLSRIPIIYSGGVSSLNDIAELTRTGVQGVIVGRAFYDGIFTLKEAVEIAKSTSS
jgi:phosphoribosylformimino-5-aminoimidazole carboxamide ribotide isomerase